MSLQGLGKEVKNVSEEVCKCRDVLGGTERLWDEGGESVLVEKVLDSLERRLKLLDTVLDQRCDSMKDKLQELTVFQVYVACIWLFLINILFFSLALSLTNTFSSISISQTELRLLLTALSDSKYQLLQKMNAAMDRPASKQMEVRHIQNDKNLCMTPSNTLLLGYE